MTTSTAELLNEDVPKVQKEEGQKFWVEDLCVLFSPLTLIPTEKMTKNERLNALTRLVLVITAILFYIQYEYWLQVLLISLFAIVLFKYGGKKDGEKESFTVTPTFSSSDMNVTTCAPLFSEEWQIPPPAYDIYENTPQWETFTAPEPQVFPFGMYMTRTNLLPSDEQSIKFLNGGPRQAKSYINSAFIRNELSSRENLQALYKKKLARRFRSNSEDTFSPYSSY
jgi:hypothetical protein